MAMEKKDVEVEEAEKEYQFVEDMAKKLTVVSYVENSIFFFSGIELNVVRLSLRRFLH